MRSDSGHAPDKLQRGQACARCTRFGLALPVPAQVPACGESIPGAAFAPSLYCQLAQDALCGAAGGTVSPSYAAGARLGLTGAGDGRRACILAGKPSSACSAAPCLPAQRWRARPARPSAARLRACVRALPRMDQWAHARVDSAPRAPPPKKRTPRAAFFGGARTPGGVGVAGAGWVARAEPGLQQALRERAGGGGQGGQEVPVCGTAPACPCLLLFSRPPARGPGARRPGVGPDGLRGRAGKARRTWLVYPRRHGRTDPGPRGGAPPTPRAPVPAARGELDAGPERGR
eukprot:scaffold695_cov384-Prasinococcus_capsulatus_cf.AAC.11